MLTDDAAWQSLRAERDALAAQVRAQADQLVEMRTLLDSAPVGIWSLHADGRLAFVNRAYCNAIGISEAEFTSAPDYAALYPPATAASCKRSDQEALQMDQVHVSREYIRFVDGEDHDLDVYKSRVKNDEGCVLGLIGISVDVTERVRLEAQLREYQAGLEAQVALRTEELRLAKEAAERSAQARSHFVSTMSHEMRTPLNAIIGLLPVARASASPDVRERHLRTVEQSAGLLLALVNDILDLSRIDSGRLRLELGSFSPRELVDQACRLLLERATSKGLQLDLRFAAEVPALLRGDAMRLEQIVLNLLTNAVKFTERGRVDVEVSARALGDGRCLICVAVQDTGIGIAAEHLERLFEAFEQGDASTARRYGGTGLGLTICRELLDCMGGSISVQSTPGQGSRFWFQVPLDLASESADAPADGSPAQSDLRGRRVLLVDDEPVNREVGRAMLENMGCAVAVADSGEQALDVLASQAFDILLLDLRMPGIDGLEVARRLRARPGQMPPPMLALTADVSDEIHQRCLQAGMAAVLTKPVPLHKLRAALQQVLVG